MADEPKVGVGALIIQNNRILLTQRHGAHGAGSYGSVGGHLEFGESPQEALIREAREELGVALGNLTFLVCANLVMYGRHYLDLGFRADIISGRPEIQPAERDRIISVAWYDLDDLPQPLFEPIKIYLAAVSSGQPFYHRRI